MVMGRKKVEKVKEKKVMAFIPKETLFLCVMKNFSRRIKGNLEL